MDEWMEVLLFDLQDGKLGNVIPKYTISYTRQRQRDKESL